MADLRVGLIGAGWVALDRYLPVLARQPGVTLVGVSDRNASKAQDAATKHRTRAFSELDQLLESGVDALFICTSPNSHASAAIAAMSAGVHVMVEKPMSVDLSDAERMVECAQRNQVKLCLSHNLLFARSVARALSRFETGVYGSLVHVFATQASSDRRRLPHWYPELPGGLFYDEAPHMLYLMDRIAGPVELTGAWAQSDGAGSFSALGADFTGSTNSRLTLRMLFNAPVSEWLLVLVLERGVIALDLFRDIAVFLPPDGVHGPVDILRTSARAIAGHLWGTVRTGMSYLSRRQFWGHDLIIAEFLASIRNGDDPPVSGEDGLRITRLLHDVLSATSSR